MFPFMFLIDRNYFELQPDRSYIVRSSIIDGDRGAIEIRLSLTDSDSLLEQKISYFSKELLKGFHLIIGVD